MYLEYFGLERSPFCEDAEIGSFHPTRSHALAMEALGGAIRDGRGPVLLTGPKGSGKTLLLRVLAAELPERYELVVVNASQALSGSLCEAVAAALGLPANRPSGECLEALRQHVSIRARRGDRTIVAVDDAHRLHAAWAEEITHFLAAKEVDIGFAFAAAGELGGDGHSQPLAVL